MAKKHGPTPDAVKKREMLKAYAATGFVSKACKRAKVGKSTHYDWLKKDKRYAKAFRSREVDYLESLEAEADRRGKQGYLKPVYQKGEMVGEIREFSDTLLIFRLKKLDPAYRDKQPEKMSAEEFQAAIDRFVTRLMMSVPAEMREHLSKAVMEAGK